MGYRIKTMKGDKKMTKIYCKYTLAVHPSNDKVDYYEVPVYF